ncbi:DUF4136 domain-containing protein [Chitinophagaceae bacterium LWZ2-11]
MLTRFITTVFIASLLIACASSAPKNFTSATVDGTDFSKYKTYAFLKPVDTAVSKGVHKKQLERLMAIETKKILDKKGMSLDTLNPDCLFTYTLAITESYDVNKQPDQVDYNYQMYQDPYSPNGGIYYFSTNNKAYIEPGKTTINKMHEGNLIIEMIDVKDNKIVWQSQFESNKVQTLPTPQDAVNYILPKMFSKFPKR